jgi:hypothetical protein
MYGCMRYLLVSLLLVFLALPRTSAGETITWFASGQVSNVSDPFHFWPGLTPGTPWSLNFTLDSNAPRSIPFGRPGCSFYPMGSAAFSLGGFSYSHGGGQVATNWALDAGCTLESDPSDPDGLITFLFLGRWEQEPGAWNLNLSPAITVFSYYDLLATDGSLPLVPVINPDRGQYAGMEHEGAMGDAEFSGGFTPTAVVSQPTPVPEPATMTLFGAGLAAALAARKRRRA